MDGRSGDGKAGRWSFIEVFVILLIVFALCYFGGHVIHFLFTTPMPKGY